MQFENSNKKAGVSLVTVLLFMLVATIAATATYKWLTSEGRSSASRLQQNEAYQSAAAGLDNARAWMAFHGNDVGALIKAFIDGGRKPINLDARLRSLQRAGQDYHVWLTGVNTEKSTFKLKLLASGESRNGTKHSEIAIFNVDGLYQVKIPEEKVHSVVPFKHNYFGGSTHSEGTIKAYSLLINGNLNGSNPVYTDVDLVVTGNINITGSSVGAAGNVCVGGNLNADNGVLGGDFYVGGNATGFTFPTTSEAAKLTNANVTGNVYIEGNLGPATTGDQKFQKNMTLNGTWTTNLGAHESSVAGNLCVGPQGQVFINSSGRTFKVDGNVWAESEKPIWWENGKDNHPEYKKIILGNKTSSEVYISGAHPAADYEILRNNRTFIEKNTYYRGSANYGMAAMTWDNKTTRPYGPIPGTATDNDKYYLYNYTGPGQDVDFIVTSVPWGWSRINYANYYVGNKILYTPAVGFYGFFGYSPEKINYLNFENNKPTNTPYCKTGPDKWRPECKVTPWFKSNGSVLRNFPESREFSCAESAKAHCDSIWSESTSGCDGAKYKVNDILVTAYTKFSEYANRGCRGDKLWDNNLSKTLNACYAANSNDPQRAIDSLYNGYQVVTVRHSQKSDPTTPLNGKFIIIVENEMGQQSLPPTTADSYAFVYLKEGATSTIQPATNNGIYNYFIYTKKDITGVMFNNADFSGSIYATAATCAKVGDFKSRNMLLNEELLSDLSENGVICEGTVSETSCGGTESGDPEPITSSTETPTGGTDSYYISMSPQLGVRLESQYKNDEALPKANETTALTPSFIVLPRVIYLPDDPYGKLTDYYNVRPLNGSTLKKSDVTVTCSGPGALPSTGSLYNAGDGALAKGIYSCTAAAASYSSVPFWVVVGNGTRGTPQVTFVEPASQEMTSNDQKDIKISVPAHGADMIVNLYCPDVPNESWEYLSFGTGVTRSGTTCKVALSASNAASEHTVFTIKTTNAIVGTHTAQILPGEGYIPGPPATAQLYISASAVLDRVEATSDDIDAFCEDHSTLCPENYATRWPDCDITDVWVEPTGAYHTLMPNDSWSIMVGNTQAVTLSASSTENDCVVIIPESSNSIAANGVEANHTYTLRASAKAKKSSFKVGFKGDVGDGHTPVINIITGTVNQQCSYSNAVVDQETSAKVCVIDVFKGEAVTVALDSLTDDAKDFSYWKCSGANCPSTETVTSKKFGTFSISEDGTALIAHFGEADKHCFFDEFKSSSVACSSEDTKYCIDKCGNDDESVCTGVVDANGTFTKSKWHLISGELSQIEVGSSQEIHIDKTVNKKKKESERTSVMVLSTVNAGIAGKLKALINVPRATASYDKSATNIKYSGFMLRANTYGNDFFMLNLYENANGELEAQLWKGDASLSSVLTNSNGVSVSVTNSSMVMVSASVTASGTIEVKANIGDYYTYDGAPTVYGYTFDLSNFNNTLADAAHEFVGFSLADPNFKIYGIGWKSDTYNSECFETFPTVKCSFAAVATDGVIKIDTLVKPWVGYSGWFDANGCSPVYYYYNGNDATTTCAGNVCTGGYQFDNSGIGAHGYTENDTEQKTAKAWLANCTKASSESVNWGVAAEDERAHCGAFWTGAFAECTAHQDLYSGNNSITDAVETITLSTKQNLRAATLRVELTNSDNSEVEIWLVSESTDWGSVDHESHSVKMNGSVGTFDVMKEFAAGSNGFDPENVKYILLKNHSTSDVSLKSITSTCANAIGITYCRAEYDGTNWNVMTQVTNKNLIASETVVAAVGADERFSMTKPASGEGGITWNGEIAFMQYTGDNPYAYRGQSYVFTATINGKTAGQTDSKLCTVTPDPIGTIGVDCSVIGTIANGARYPTFNVNFSGCPSGGCGYAIYVEDESDPITSGRELTSVRFSANKTGECNSSAGCEHTYTVRSTDDDSEFEECSATFKVMRDQSDLPPTVTCGISTNNYGSYNGTFYTTDNVYFWSKNRESVEATYALELHEGESTIGSGTLNNWSNHSVINLGKLSAGTHTYELFAKGEKICDATVVINDRSANADLLCGVSTHNYDISGGDVFNNIDNLYFMAKNNESTNDKLTDIDVYRGTTSLATTEIAANSNWTNTYSIGTLGKGTYTFKLMYGETELCSHSIEVRTIADDANLTCGVSTHNYDISGGSTFNPTDYLYFMAKNNASVNYTVDALSVYKNNVQVVASIDISANSNWTKTLDIGALDAGTYTFALKNGSQLKCEHEITVSGPSSSSSATPASSGSDETDGVICLNAQNAEANVGGSSKNANIGPGTYTFLHNCASRGWWYTCTGTKITIGSTDYSCSGSQTSTWDGGGPIDGVNSPPESGATLVVPTGTTFQNIGCSKSDNSPVDGCSTTGVTKNYFNCVSDINGGIEIPSGIKTFKCRNDGYCIAKNLHCCPSSDCYNGSVSPWKVNNTSQSTSPRAHNVITSCSDGTTVTIESSGGLKCGVFNN